MKNQKGEISEGALGFLVFMGVVLLVVLVLGGWPLYRVWQQGLTGEAALKRAEQERRIQVEQAQAERDSAELVAEAIAIVGQAAKDYPEYRQQQFIAGFSEALQEGLIEQIIYIPTEANIPILEAGKRTGQ